MKMCFACQTEIAGDTVVGRQAFCPSCGADLHVCRNCAFYEPGAYNDCREPQAERVVDKIRSNFCDYFRFQNGAGKAGTPAAAAKEKLEACFKNSFSAARLI
jgi:ribosome-binding protein aMBF1 (putative translation factor)